MRREIEAIATEDIHVGGRLRVSVSDAKVAALADSMSEIGLQTPISVRIAEKVVIDGEDVFEVPVLVAGRTRLLAAQKLGWEKIDCFILPQNIDARLWEIDENLIRSELSPSEEAQHFAERKKLWEAKKAEEAEASGTSCPTSKGGSDSSGVGHKGFAADTAEKTGRSKKDVNRAVSRAVVPPDVMNLIHGTALDTGAYLDQLKKLLHEDGSADAAAMRDKVERDFEAHARKERDKALREEQKERKKEAKEARERALRAACDLLLDALPSKKWDELIGLLEQAGGSLRVRDLREWQSPSSEQTEAA